MTIVIKGGSVVGVSGVEKADVLVDNDIIVKVGKNLTGNITLDATDCHIFPGFVDLHAHLREPGREDTETIETASRAGAKGGYTALIAMPNTNPAHDSVTVIEFVREQARKAGLLDVFPSGCITMGRLGEALAPLAELSAAGVRIFTDDGSGVQDPVLMGRAMQYAKTLGITMAQHCEVSALTQGAVNEILRCLE
jgi:dihydroorotase